LLGLEPWPEQIRRLQPHSVWKVAVAGMTVRAGLFAAGMISGWRVLR